MGHTQPIVIPDTDGELMLWLDRLEELLLSLTPHADDADPWAPPTAPLGSGTALAALQRLSIAVHQAERAGAPTLIAPDGRFELVPLLLLRVDPADVATLAQAIIILGQINVADGDEIITDVLADLAICHGLATRDFIAGCSRALTVLNQGATDDTEALAAAIASAQGRIVLTPSQHAAYLRVTGEHIAVFHLNDPLAHFIYGR